MKSKWFLVVTFVSAVYSAAIYQKSIEIPVKIIYDKVNFQTASSRNLNSYSSESNVGIRNLEEKPQLSPGQLSEAGKHLPIPEVDVQTELDELKSEIAEPIDEIIKTNEVYDKIEKIVLNGANDIKTNVDNIKVEDDEPTKADLLSKVNATLETFLEFTKKLSESKNSLKLALPGNFLTEVRSNFQSASADLFKDVSESQSTKQTASNNPFQTIVTQIQNSFQQIANNINNINNQGETQGTVLGDAQPTQSPNPFQIVQSAGQQLVQNINNIINRPVTSAPAATEGDEQTSQPTQTNPLQTIQTALQNFNPFQQGSQNTGSEESTNPGPLQFLQNAGQQVAQVINNANPFTQTPNSESDESSSSQPTGPLTFLQNAGQQVVQAIGNAFNPATQAPNVQGDATTASQPGGPLSILQNAGQQVIQAINNANPFNPQTTAKPATENDPLPDSSTAISSSEVPVRKPIEDIQTVEVSKPIEDEEVVKPNEITDANGSVEVEESSESNEIKEST